MRTSLLLPLLIAAATAGCVYVPTDPDPIRVVISPVDVAACRSLGSVGRTRTDGVSRGGFAEITTAPPAVPARSSEPAGPNFGIRLDALEAEALRRGATDLLLRRRILRDWSYVEGVAYRCRG